MSSPPRVAIVHDWLTNMGGAERVVLALHEAFPDAPIYTSVYDPAKLPLFKGLDIRTTKLQNWPRFLAKLHKFFPMLRVKAFQRLDLGEFDVIISSSSAEAKQVRKTRPEQIHICYCHTPIRYYWSHYEDYKKDPGFGKLNRLIRLAMPLLVPKLKAADYSAAQAVDVFIANSSAVQKRIKQYYHKDSLVIYPPVDTERFASLPEPARREGFVIVSRQVPYKRVDLAVQACSELKLPLTVYGRGSEHQRLQKLAGPSIKFVSDASDEAIAKALKSAQAFIFPAEEDFGIVQIEALAAGTPVIAYAKGGSLDIVAEGQNGILFDYQTVDSLIEALQKFEFQHYDNAVVGKSSLRYSKHIFVDFVRKLVNDLKPTVA